MRGFPILPFFLIFLVVLVTLQKKSAKNYKQKNDEFWAKEKAANATPAKDINNLNYINIPLDKFPLHFSDDPDLVRLEKDLENLSTKKMLNLTGVSNTDLKATYGVPNLGYMQEIGDNFDKLTMCLQDYAQRLYELGKIAECISVLEFAVGIGTDISHSYKLLAQCYMETGKKQKIIFLQEKIANSNLMTKKALIDYCDEFLGLEAGAKE